MITTIQVIEDTFIRQSSASTNYDGETYLVLGKTGSGSQVDRLLMRYDFSPVRGDIINSATLYIYQVYSSYAYSATQVFTAHCISSAFQASTVTWKTQPSFTSNGMVTLSLSGNATGQRTFDITALVRDIIANNRTCYGILLKQANESTSSLRKQFNSKEYGGGSRAAYIVIDHSDPPPEPTITGFIATPQGAINKSIVSMYIAPSQGAISKQVTKIYIAPSQGAINKTVM
jgi:hypothetical protein